MSQNGNEGKILHPIKEILKTFDENKNLKKSKKNKKHSRNHSTGYDYKNEISMTNKSEQQQQNKSSLLKNYKFFSKRQYSDTENIYDIDSMTTGSITNNNEQIKNNNNKKNLSFFHKLFKHIFKRKSNRMLLQSVEDLYTPVVKSDCCLAKD